MIRCAVDPVKLRAGKHEINLPAGSAYLAVARPEHLQAQLDHLFAFTKVDDDGDPYAVDCPPDLARYALANANLLPLQFISRTPVLRAGRQRPGPARLRSCDRHLLRAGRDVPADPGRARPRTMQPGPSSGCGTRSAASPSSRTSTAMPSSARS